MNSYNAGINKNDGLRETAASSNNDIDTVVPSKLVKKAKKKRSFRKVLLPKNLLNVKSCYTPSSSSSSSSHAHHDDSSSHYHSHLLTPKKTT